MIAQKNLEDMIPEQEYEIIKTLALMSELDPAEEVRKSAKMSLFKRYDGKVQSFSQDDGIYVTLLYGNIMTPAYVCEKENYELKIAKTSDDHPNKDRLVYKIKSIFRNF
ncbi:MAG: hypothetical protein ACOCUR_01155 [Nanoarchaeota archaeon]